MNNGFELIREYIEKYDKFVISTHQSPDADGLGSCIAFRDLMVSMGKTALIINSDPTPETLLFFDPDKEINVINEGYKIPDNIGEYAQVVLDTNDYDNIGIAYELLKDRVKDLFIIDHHEGGKTSSTPTTSRPAHHRLRRSFTGSSGILTSPFPSRRHRPSTPASSLTPAPSSIPKPPGRPTASPATAWTWA